MDETYKKQRKTTRVLVQKKQERERRIKEMKNANMNRLNKQIQEFEKDQQKLKTQGDEKSKRSLNFYDKLFKDGKESREQGTKKFGPRNDSESNPKVGDNETQDEAPKKIWLPREEFLKQKREREFKSKEKRKFKSLYGRKTSKGQPIMKYRINHLLSKIKSGNQRT